MRLARDAVRLNDNPNDRDILAEYCDTLTAAYAEVGHFADTVAEHERAIKILRAAGRDDEVADFYNRLNLEIRRAIIGFEEPPEGVITDVGWNLGHSC